jgi:D-sedoheptulose 7-phosphate isomerase
VALNGKSGGAAGRAADDHVNVPDTATARIQEAHTTMLHLMCELVDDELAG